MLTLTSGEEILYQARIHRMCYGFPLLLLALGLMLQYGSAAKPTEGNTFYAYWLFIMAMSEYIKTFIPTSVAPLLEASNNIRLNYAAMLLMTVGFLKIALAYAYRNLSRYLVTSKRVVALPWGYKKEMTEIPLESIAAVRLHSSPFGKLMNMSRVVVNDKGMREIEIHFLSKPHQFEKIVYAAAKKYRQRLPIR